MDKWTNGHVEGSSSSRGWVLKGDQTFGIVNRSAGVDKPRQTKCRVHVKEKKKKAHNSKLTQSIDQTA